MIIRLLQKLYGSDLVVPFHAAHSDPNRDLLLDKRGRATAACLPSQQLRATKVHGQFTSGKLDLGLLHILIALHILINTKCARFEKSLTPRNWRFTDHNNSVNFWGHSSVVKVRVK